MVFDIGLKLIERAHALEHIGLHARPQHRRQLAAQDVQRPARSGRRDRSTKAISDSTPQRVKVLSGDVARRIATGVATTELGADATHRRPDVSLGPWCTAFIGRRGCGRMRNPSRGSESRNHESFLLVLLFVTPARCVGDALTQRVERSSGCCTAFKLRKQFVTDRVGLRRCANVQNSASHQSWVKTPAFSMSTGERVGGLVGGRDEVGDEVSDGALVSAHVWSQR